jgi:Mor family transcriptional regulator
MKLQNKDKRNESLLKDYNNGDTITTLVIKYRISDTRIYEILRRFEGKNIKVKRKEVKKNG